MNDLTKEIKEEIVNTIQELINEDHCGFKPDGTPVSVISYNTFDDDFMVYGGSMSDEDWLYFGRDLAVAICRNFDYYYQTDGYSCRHVRLKRVEDTYELDLHLNGYF